MEAKGAGLIGCPKGATHGDDMEYMNYYEICDFGVGGQNP